MLRKAQAQGIVERWSDMYDHFRDATEPTSLPLFSGDYWVEALARHAAHVCRSEFKGGKRGDKEKGAKAGSADGKGGAKAKGNDGAKPVPSCLASVVAADTPPHTPVPLSRAVSLTPSISRAVSLTPSIFGAGVGAPVSSSGAKLLHQIKEEMRAMRNHFIVLTFAKPAARAPASDEAAPRAPTPAAAAAAPAADGGGGWLQLGADLSEASTGSSAFSSRMALLSLCKTHHWQFDELRFAQYSSRMLLHVLTHSLCFRPDMQSNYVAGHDCDPVVDMDDGAAAAEAPPAADDGSGVKLEEARPADGAADAPGAPAGAAPNPAPEGGAAGAPASAERSLSPGPTTETAADADDATEPTERSRSATNSGVDSAHADAAEAAETGADALGAPARAAKRARATPQPPQPSAVPPADPLPPAAEGQGAATAPMELV